MSEDSIVLSNWYEFKQIVVDTDLDILKNIGGNTSAGIRARKNLRVLKKIASKIIAQTLIDYKPKKVRK